MREATSSTPATHTARHVVEILDHHHAALLYLSRIKSTAERRLSVQQLVGRAIVRMLIDEGIYISHRGMQPACPVESCKRALTAASVSKYLKVKNLWICDHCHKDINREIELWVAEQRRAPVRRLEERGIVTR